MKHRLRDRPGLATRFFRHLDEDGRVQAGDRLLVALSGGVDSLVLLHLLRFGSGTLPLNVTAAHFDHGMRPESAEEAEWVRGLCCAWDVPLRTARAESRLLSEEEARDARYAFLFRIRREERARWLLTGHQADDQAETVLFRILRGTGLEGLKGIPAHRPPGLYRPLLPFTRAEIEDYSVESGLRPRRDPTNKDPRHPRNYLRHEILPMAEAHVSSGARAAVRRLARLAQENEEAWSSLIPTLLEGVLAGTGDPISIVRSRLLAYDAPVRARILREALRRAGVSLDGAGTRMALEFTRTGKSGRFVALTGGFRLKRDFDRLSIVPAEGLPAEGLPAEGLPAEGAPAERAEREERERGEWERKKIRDERFLSVQGPAAGAGTAILGGEAFEVRWGPEECKRWEYVLHAAARDLRFPLQVRAWAEGDRISLPYGTKKLKKLFAEKRVPVEDRTRVPVLSDDAGRILWIAGLASSASIRTDRPDFFLAVRSADRGPRRR